jgi:hypothetical protein
MTEAPEHVDTTTLPAESFLGAKRFRVTCLCKRCGKTFRYTTAKITDTDRPCPKKACKQAAHSEQVMREAENLSRMIESQRPPGHIGEKISVKAVDETAKIVMEDHHLTDLKDNIRTGEAMAPKLPGDQQRLADGFFGGEAVRERVGLPKKQMDLLGRRAMAGAYRNMSVNPMAAVPGKRGEPPLHLVRTETIK